MKRFGLLTITLAAFGCGGGESDKTKTSPPSAEKPAAPAPAAPGKYEVVAVTNGGTITGKVRFKGTPDIVKIKVEKDPATCHDEKESPRLKVGPTGGLANAVVYLEDIHKGAGIDAMPAGSMDQKDCEYVPHVQVVPWNKEFVVKSSDPILHNVDMTFADNGASVMNQPFPEPSQVKKKFKRPGIAQTKCDAGHVWMSATIFAVEHPYYAVTDSDGGYVLHDVPPGTYKLVCWHEGYKLVELQKTGCTWSPDVVEKKDVTVQTGSTAPIDFTIGG
ncbi:MAG: carboxypeptidase regulatory-like domain-containing protein [Planctomycetes bacterium]|nr:carboxypeptidase regulatory-like domain-containing protein [Planctomycetota bacterium]